MLNSLAPTSSGAFNNQNQLGAAGTCCDSSGNLTSIGGYGFTYDAEGRLQQVTMNGGTVTYTYDGLG